MTAGEGQYVSQGRKPVVILGAGGHACVLHSLLSMQKRRVLAILDDDPATHGKRFGTSDLEIEGGLADVKCYAPKDIELVNAIGSTHRPTARQVVYEKMVDLGYIFATLRHSSAVVACEALIEPSAQIMARAVIQTGTQLRANVLINTGTIIDHDTVVGEHTHVASGATICGGVTIGQGCHIGAGSTVIQGIQIGHGAIIAAGATVVSNIADGLTVVGTPAKVMNK